MRGLLAISKPGADEARTKGEACRAGAQRRTASTAFLARGEMAAHQAAQPRRGGARGRKPHAAVAGLSRFRHHRQSEGRARPTARTAPTHASPSSAWPRMTPAKWERLKAEALCILIARRNSVTRGDLPPR